MEYSMFLCHSSGDKPFVRMVAKKLEKQGIKSWIDEAEILPGDSIVTKINEGINKTIFFLAFISDNSIKSGWVNYELENALTDEMQKETLVIPAKLGECNIPSILKHKNYADFSNLDNIDSEIDRIVKQVRTYKVEKKEISPIKVEKKKSENENALEDIVTNPKEIYDARFIKGGFIGLQKEIINLESDKKGKKRLAVFGGLPSHLRLSKLDYETASMIFSNQDDEQTIREYQNLVNIRKKSFEEYIENKENYAITIFFQQDIIDYVTTQHSSIDQIPDPPKEIIERLNALLKYNDEPNYELHLLFEKKVLPKFFLMYNVGLIIDMRTSPISFADKHFSDSISGLYTNSDDILTRFKTQISSLTRNDINRRTKNREFLKGLLEEIGKKL